jgi:hypothetical protein
VAPVLPPAELDRPETVAALALAACCIVLASSGIIQDTDFWQHLAVGRAIWTLHRVPDTQLWSWPTYGAPDVNTSWLFRALIWPVWQPGGLWGLFAWRWLTSLLAIGILYACARRMGARGYGAIAAVVLCANVYSQRVQVRPETLVAILLASTIALLEDRRRDGRASLPRDGALVALGWAWANSHISSPLWFALVGVYWIDDLVRARQAGRASRPAELALVLGAGLLLSLANPFGIHALLQPFGFLFGERDQRIYRTIAELDRLHWRANLSNGYPILLAVWVLLALWRNRQRRIDLVELLLLVGFGALSMRIQRFSGFFGLVALPFVARDLAEWLAARRWPAWAAARAPRVALVSAVCLALAFGRWAGQWDQVGVRMDDRRFPIRACDFLAAQQVRGRAFNPFHLGGYLLYRFWPDRSRLPFMDIHQAGTPEIRDQYVDAMSQPGGWPALRDRYAIDWVLGWRVQVAGDHLLDFLDADSSFALVFLDDAAALYVRRRGPLAGVAQRFAYHALPGGRAAIGALGAACAADSALRQRVRQELERQAAGSPYDATAQTLLASIALQESRWEDARAALTRALRVDPTTPRLHERLAIIAMAERRWDEARQEIARERRIDPRNPNLPALAERVASARSGGVP